MNRCPYQKLHRRGSRARGSVSRLLVPRFQSPERGRHSGGQSQTPCADTRDRKHGEREQRPSWHGVRRSGGATLVVVMQATDVWNLNDRAEGRWESSPRDGSIPVQREVSSPVVIVNKIALRSDAPPRSNERCGVGRE